MDAGTGKDISHILILEDDRTHQELSLRAFRTDPEQFRVSIAGTLREAREIIGQDPPALIISDWLLPDGKGLEILPRRDGRVTIPLIIMTSYGDEHLAVEIMKSGAIDYVVKSATMFRDLPHISRRALRDWENFRERQRAEESVQETQKRLADILGFLPDAVLAVDNDGRVIAWNHAIEQMTGVTATDMLGKGDHEYSIPFYGERRPILVDLVLADDPETEKNYAFVLREGERIISETFIPAPFGGNGEYLWATASPLYDSAGNRAGAIEVIRDITERKSAELALQKSEEKFRHVFDWANDAIMLHTLTAEGSPGRFIDVNQVACRMLGYTRDELLTMGPPAIVPAECYPQLMEITRHAATKESVLFETRFLRKDGTTFPVESSGHMVTYEGKRIWVSHIRDITERKQAEEALRELSVYNRSLIEASIDPLVTIDHEGKIQDVNSATEKATGISRDELINTDFSEYFTEPEKAREGYRQVFSEGNVIDYPLEIRHIDGHSIPVLYNATLYHDALGNIRGVFAAARDITVRKLAEEKLRESEKKYRFLVDNVRDVVWQATPDLTFTYLSPAIKTQIGYPPEDLIGTSLFGILTESSARSIQKRLSERTEEYSPGSRDVPTAFEAELIKKDGSTCWFEVSSNPIFGSDGNLVGFQGISRNINERKQAEEKLRESEDRYRNLVQGVPDYILVHRMGTILYVNAVLAGALGYSPEEMIGSSIMPFVAPEDHPLAVNMVRKRGEGDSIPPYRLTILTRDSRRLSAEVRGALIQFDGSTATLNVLTDITDRTKAEEKLRESEERLLMAQEIGHIGGWEYNLQTNEIWGSAEGARIYGLPPVTGNFPIDQIEACIPERERVHQALIDLIHEEKEYNLEFAINPADGSPQKVIMSIALLEKDAQGNPIKVVGVIQDITHRKLAEEALRESRQILEEILNTIPVRVFWKNKELTYLGCNTAFARDAGFEKPEDIIGRDDYFMGWREEAERYRNDDRAVIESGNPKLLFEEPQTTPSGEMIYLLTSKVPLLGTNGEVIGILGTYLDITERKRSEEALRATETRFSALIQNSSDIIHILDRDGRITYESISAERILGYPAGSLIGSNSLEYIHLDDLERVKKSFQEVLDGTNTGTPTEFRIRKADGTYIWVDSIGSNLLDVPGVNGIVLTTRPIQERKEADQALRENEARLATAMEIASLVNWEFDATTGMFIFDDRFYALYETTAEREGGHLMSAEAYLQEFVYPDDRPAVLTAIQKILATTDPEYFGQAEYRITPRDGSVRTIIARFAPVMGPKGTVIRTIGANQDITGYKLMESEIRSLNTALEQRVRDRTEALSRANEALEAEIVQRQEAEKKLHASYDEKVMLLKEIHHRVKNNLQIVASLLNLQSRYITDVQTLAAIRESQNRVKAMALVHERLYRTEDISHISLHDYIRFLGTGLFQFYDAKSRGIRFTLEIQDITVNIDTAIPLGLILNELISNTLKYAFPEGRSGEISISVKKDDHTLSVLYRDTGIGIPAELDWRNTPSLGLRLVTTLVEQLDGTVDLDRSAGTQFTMVLHEKEPRGPV